MFYIACAGLGPVTDPKPARRSRRNRLLGHGPEQRPPGRRRQAHGLLVASLKDSPATQSYSGLPKPLGCWGPRTGRSRSHGLSVRQSMATAHSSTARIRRRTKRATLASRARWGKRLQHVATGDLGDRPVAEAREGIHLQRADPELRGLRRVPPGALLLDDASRSLGEGRHAEGAALSRQRIAARAGQLSLRERLLACLRKRDLVFFLTSSSLAWPWELMQVGV